MTMNNFKYPTIAVICIDFDGTLVDEERWPSTPSFKEGAKEAILKLRQKGFYIKIYSARNNPTIRDQEARFSQMVEFLDEHKVPYDEIVIEPKPIAKFYVDDRAIRFESWEQVTNDIDAELGNS